MNTNKHELDNKVLFKDEVYQIVGCAFDLHNSLGHGFHEKIYENGLKVEFKQKQIPYSQQSRYSILHKGEALGEYIPDFVVCNKVIVEIKTVDRVTNNERGQVLNYLKVTNLQVGLLLNFKNAKLEWERIVLSQR